MHETCPCARVAIHVHPTQLFLAKRVDKCRLPKNREAAHVPYLHRKHVGVSRGRCQSTSSIARNIGFTDLDLSLEWPSGCESYRLIDSKSLDQLTQAQLVAVSQSEAQGSIHVLARSSAPSLAQPPQEHTTTGPERKQGEKSGTHRMRGSMPCPIQRLVV